jgi:hypothetical protein
LNFSTNPKDIWTLKMEEACYRSVEGRRRKKFRRRRRRRRRKPKLQEVVE